MGASICLHKQHLIQTIEWHLKNYISERVQLKDVGGWVFLSCVFSVQIVNQSLKILQNVSS